MKKDRKAPGEARPINMKAIYAEIYELLTGIGFDLGREAMERKLEQARRRVKELMDKA